MPKYFRKFSIKNVEGLTLEDIGFIYLETLWLRNTIYPNYVANGTSLDHCGKFCCAERFLIVPLNVP